MKTKGDLAKQEMAVLWFPDWTRDIPARRCDSPTLYRPLHFLWWKRVFFFWWKVGSFCVSSTGNVEVKEQDGISFKTPRSLSSVTLLSLSRYKSFPVVIEHKSFRSLGTFCTLFTRWINIHFKVNMKIGPIYFLNTHSWFSTACFSKEEKYIYLHYPSLKLALQPIWRSFLADATYACSLKNDEPFKVLWAFLFRTWTDYYDVELQISAQRRKK